ncbi:hypothetical protein [Roseateles violae]|uniref:Uncharacterized protein n=1 Tax=Roseateles violae TaxID=3058042 RepID=A0ABT8DZA5_9BURK|nr:hypothetical protein [Pelomonas sp. PFR6]MDN3922885.1 hypothetical protein [Pelomonas sp. PFR6]
MPGSDARKPLSAKALLWIERLVWILIYAGLLAASLGLFLRLGAPEGHVLGYVLMVKGGIAAAVGVVLIWIRSRFP